MAIELKQVSLVAIPERPWTGCKTWETKQSWVKWELDTDYGMSIKG
jgi:hypothetical protein